MNWLKYIFLCGMVLSFLAAGIAMFCTGHPGWGGTLIIFSLMTVSTIKALFRGKKDLFKELVIYDKPYVLPRFHSIFA